MRLTLKSAWTNSRNLIPVSVGNEFINIKKSWDDQNFGISPVDRINSQGSVTFPVNTVSSAYTASDNDFFILANTSSAFTLTLPDASRMPGRFYVAMCVGVKNLTVGTTSGQTINGGSSYVLPGKYYSVELFSDGSNWFAR